MRSLLSNKLFSYSLLAILILLLLTGLYFLNIYLKNNNLLIHATGTNDKAFLNSTWRMSVKEVERANETNLVFGGKAIYGGIDLFVNCIFGDTLEEKLPKNNIYSCYKDRVYIFGKLSGVTYNFFDNEFYEYYVSTPVSDCQAPKNRSTL